MTNQHTAKSKARKRKMRHEVEFYTYPKFLFCWPLIVMGFVLAGLARQGWVAAETLAWIWGITLVIVMVTVGFDLSRNFTIFMGHDDKGEVTG